MGEQCSGKIREMSRRGDKTEMSTTVPIKRVVGGCEIESKRLSKNRGAGMCESLPPTFYRVFPPFLNMNPFIILKSQSPSYIFKNAPWEGRNIKKT